MAVFFDKSRGYWRYLFEVNKIKFYSPAPGFKTKKEAQKARSLHRDAIKNPPPPEPSRTDITFFDLVTKRLDYVQVYFVTRHYADYRYMARRWVRLWGKMMCSDITQEQIQQFIIKRGKSAAGTGNKEIVYLRATFNYGIKKNLIKNNPTKGIEFLPVEKKVKYVPSKEDVWKVLLAAGQDVQDYLLVLKETLARMSEINQLTWEEVDLQKRVVTLYTRKKKGGNRTPRKLAMTSKLFDILSRRYADRRKDLPWVFWHSYTSSKTKERKEGPYTDRPKIMKTLCTKAGVKYFRFHALRHFGASLLADSGVPIEVTQKILGHENRTTTEIYLHTIGEAERKAMEVLERDGEIKDKKGMEDIK